MQCVAATTAYGGVCLRALRLPGGQARSWLVTVFSRPHPQPFSRGEKGACPPSPPGRGTEGEGEVLALMRMLRMVANQEPA
jgi:hypothetical protein